MKKKEKDLFVKLIKEKKGALVEQKHDLKTAGELTGARDVQIEKELKELNEVLLHLITGVW